MCLGPSQVRTPPPGSQGCGGGSEGWAVVPAGRAGAQDQCPGAHQHQLRPWGGPAAGLYPGSALLELWGVRGDG